MREMLGVDVSVEDLDVDGGKMSADVTSEEAMAFLEVSFGN
jgi:hypothetical protein